jgi:hypothetical protein
MKAASPYDRSNPSGAHAFRISSTLLVMSLASAFAQTAPATPVRAGTATTPPPSSETILLSPFEVSTERDTGLVASSALAGGRLNLDLKDVPAAYRLGSQLRLLYDHGGLPLPPEGAPRIALQFPGEQRAQ